MSLDKVQQIKIHKAAFEHRFLGVFNALGGIPSSLLRSENAVDLIQEAQANLDEMLAIAEHIYSVDDTSIEHVEQIKSEIKTPKAIKKEAKKESVPKSDNVIDSASNDDTDKSQTLEQSQGSDSDA